MTMQSPKVERLRWGEVDLDDGRRFKDVKLFPGGAREWDWGETGTRHSPGIQLTDVQELLDHGAEVIVLSKGQLGRLRVATETLEALSRLDIKVHIHTTPEAVRTYNRLRIREPVGALIHSTC